MKTQKGFILRTLEEDSLRKTGLTETELMGALLGKAPVREKRNWSVDGVLPPAKRKRRLSLPQPTKPLLLRKPLERTLCVAWQKTAQRSSIELAVYSSRSLGFYVWI